MKMTWKGLAIAVLASTALGVWQTAEAQTAKYDLMKNIPGTLQKVGNGQYKMSFLLKRHNIGNCRPSAGTISVTQAKLLYYNRSDELLGSISVRPETDFVHSEMASWGSDLDCEGVRQVTIFFNILEMQQIVARLRRLGNQIERLGIDARFSAAMVTLDQGPSSQRRLFVQTPVAEALVSALQVNAAGRATFVRDEIHE